MLTDLPARAASPCWYAFRAWIEQGFKVIKGGALHWQNTRMTKAERAERLWLALAVTILWMVVIGATVEGVERKETLGEVATTAQPSAARAHRLFQEGLARCLAALIQGQRLPKGKLAPEPWADTWHDVITPTEQEFTSCELYP